MYCDQAHIKFHDYFIRSKRDISVFFGWVDAIITVIFFWMIISLNASQKEAVANIYKVQLSPALFSLEITNLPHKVPKEELRGKLWDHFEEYLNNEMPQLKNSNNGEKNKPKIFDVQIGESSSALQSRFKIASISK